MKSRGIRFPGRNNESLAPIFTPPHSASAPEADISLAHLIQQDAVPVQSFTSKQIKEAFDVARNSIELLSTVLSSSNQQGVLKVFYLVFIMLYTSSCSLCAPFWRLSFEFDINIFWTIIF